MKLKQNLKFKIQLLIFLYTNYIQEAGQMFGCLCLNVYK